MLNTLANYGILPRTGRSITLQALMSALNAEESLVEAFLPAGFTTSPEPNATSFSLQVSILSRQASCKLTLGHSEDIRKHNAIEHDASLR